MLLLRKQSINVTLLITFWSKENISQRGIRHSDKQVNQAAYKQRIIVIIKNRITDGGLYIKKADNKL